MYFIYTIKPTSALILRLLHTICRNSDMLRSILIIFWELLNISKAYKTVTCWLPKHQLDILLIWHVHTINVLPIYNNQPNTCNYIYYIIIII